MIARLHPEMVEIVWEKIRKQSTARPATAVSTCGMVNSLPPGLP